MDQNASLVTAGVGLVIILGAAFLVYQFLIVSQGDIEIADINIAEQASQGVLPDFGEATNPVDSLAEVNPVEQANPFAGSYKNPFE